MKGLISVDQVPVFEGLCEVSALRVIHKWAIPKVNVFRNRLNKKLDSVTIFKRLINTLLTVVIHEIFTLKCPWREPEYFCFNKILISWAAGTLSWLRKKI